MASHLRKLLYEDPDIPPGCESFCIPHNTDVKCPSICIVPCPFFCRIPTDNIPSPPTTLTGVGIIKNNLSEHHTSLSGPLFVAFAFLLVVGFFFFKGCTLRTRNQPVELDHDPNQDPVMEHHVSHIRTAAITEITIVKYKKGDGLIEGTECSVCLNGFEENETLRLLSKCSHAFHVLCINTWLLSHTTCPLCRAEIVDSVPSREVMC